MYALKCFLVVCFLAISSNGQQAPAEVPQTVTTNMSFRQLTSTRELFTTITAQTSEGQHCEFLARALGQKNLFTTWGCIKYTPDTNGGNYYINTKSSTILELEVASGLRYVMFTLKKFL